jgi:cell division protein ZapA (FtsZ GTPase activity inhibitor)
MHRVASKCLIMEEKDDSKQLTVLIAGRPYPLKIKAGDEASIRRIVKEVNQKINEFQLAYPSRDKQDSMAMTVLSYAVDSFKARKSSSIDEPAFSAKLTDIESMLDQLLP